MGAKRGTPQAAALALDLKAVRAWEEVHARRLVILFLPPNYSSCGRAMISLNGNARRRTVASRDDAAAISGRFDVVAIFAPSLEAALPASFGSVGVSFGDGVVGAIIASM